MQVAKAATLEVQQAGATQNGAGIEAVVENIAKLSSPLQIMDEVRVLLNSLAQTHWMSFS